ncbi:MAG: D-alanyl-D-alanine carboxypeptidase [Clostridia bacterium]|nr:D-alanyl-D-alanine carboxypeptidase [Clostridia bacterium]
MRIYKALAVVLATALSVFLPFGVCANTVSSECDISDINTPIASTGAAVQTGGTLDIKAKSAILLEPGTLEVLYEDNSDEKLPPASITKIMSLLLIMEAIDRGDLAVDDVINASAHAASMGGSQIWLKENESMTVDDLLKAAVIASANDATVALAEAVAGSEEEFVRRMNEKAKELGMSGTVFKNATGLDDKGHISTARDVAIMSAALIKYPLIKNYSTVWIDSLRDGKSELVNTNKLVRFYKGTTGLKTGTTSGAGYCLAATALRDGMELVAVIMGGESSAARFEGAKKLLDYGFANYSFKEIKPEFKDGTKIAVTGGEEPEVALAAGEGLGILQKKSEQGKTTQKINLKSSISAPVKAGDKVGEIEVFSGDGLIGTIDITAKAGVKKMSIKTAFVWLLKGLLQS